MMKAKEYLEQIKLYDVLIECKMFEKKQWEDTKEQVYGTTSSFGESIIVNGELQNMEKVQKSMSTSSPVEETVLQYADIDIRYAEEIRKLMDEREQIINTIMQLSPEHSRFLHRVYVQHLTLGTVAATYNKTYSWATTIHGRALAEVQKILDTIKQNMIEKTGRIKACQ